VAKTKCCKGIKLGSIPAVVKKPFNVRHRCLLIPSETRKSEVE
jgi:hypothetical protein